MLLLLFSYSRGVQFFLAGEMNKALPMSPKRVRSITVSSADTTVELVGSPGELVQFDICHVDADGGDCDTRLDYCNAVHCETVNCKITGSGTATLHAVHSVCY